MESSVARHVDNARLQWIFANETWEYVLSLRLASRQATDVVFPPPNLVIYSRNRPPKKEA